MRIGGETWTARPYDEALVIPAGEWVDVLAIDGATAVVHPTTLPGRRRAGDLIRRIGVAS